MLHTCGPFAVCRLHLSGRLPHLDCLLDRAQVGRVLMCMCAHAVLHWQASRWCRQLVQAGCAASCAGRGAAAGIQHQQPHCGWARWVAGSCCGQGTLCCGHSCRHGILTAAAAGLQLMRSLELLGEPLPAEPDRRSIIQFLASCQVRAGVTAEFRRRTLHGFAVTV